MLDSMDGFGWGVHFGVKHVWADGDGSVATEILLESCNRGICDEFEFLDPVGAKSCSGRRI